MPAPKRKRASKNERNDPHVLTVRIAPETQRLLQKYALKRSHAEGRHISLNQCVVQLIEQAVG